MKSKKLAKPYIPLPDSFLAEHATKKATENEIKRLETIENEKRFVVPKDDEEYASYLWEQIERNAEDELTVADLTFALENLYMSIPTQKRLEKLIQDKQPTEKKPYEMTFEEWQKKEFWSGERHKVVIERKGDNFILSVLSKENRVLSKSLIERKNIEIEKVDITYLNRNVAYFMEILYNREKRNHHLRALRALRFGEPTTPTSDKFRLVPTENGYKAVRGLGSVSEREQEFENLVELFKGENEENYPLAEAVAENYADLFKSKYNLDMKYLKYFKNIFKVERIFEAEIFEFNDKNIGDYDFYRIKDEKVLKTIIDLKKLLLTTENDFKNTFRKESSLDARIDYEKLVKLAFYKDINFHDPKFNSFHSQKHKIIRDLYNIFVAYYIISTDDARKYLRTTVFRIVFDFADSGFISQSLVADFVYKTIGEFIEDFENSGMQGLGSVSNNINEYFDFDKEVEDFLEELKKDFPKTFKIRAFEKYKVVFFKSPAMLQRSFGVMDISGVTNSYFPLFIEDKEFYTHKERSYPTAYEKNKTDLIYLLLRYSQNYENSYLFGKYFHLLPQNTAVFFVNKSIYHKHNLQKLRF